MRTASHDFVPGGFDRIEKLWDGNEPVDPREESLAAATLDKHDGIVRRNLGMSDAEVPESPLNLNVLSQQTVISVDVRPEGEPPPSDT